ncbi:MAG: IS66 family insertion sequence element accessory protein TnpB [Candidatus Binatia bacterium]
MIPSTVRIFLCTEPVDMRLGFDRLAAAARSRLGIDPQGGEVLVAFANRGATRLKLLWFDRNGYCLLYKRLHRALFALPQPADAGDVAVRLDGRGLATLLAGVDRPSARHRLGNSFARARHTLTLVPAR